MLSSTKKIFSESMGKLFRLFRQSSSRDPKSEEDLFDFLIECDFGPTLSERFLKELSGKGEVGEEASSESIFKKKLLSILEDVFKEHPCESPFLKLVRTFRQHGMSKSPTEEELGNGNSMVERNSSHTSAREASARASKGWGQFFSSFITKDAPSSTPQVLDDVRQREVGDWVKKKKCFLIFGVNGSGKTTTVPKIAYFFKQKGIHLGIISGDTYRAASHAQLKAWADKFAFPFFFDEQVKDPSAAIYKGLSYFQNVDHASIDGVIVDTAGRFPSAHNLMQELKKIYITVMRFEGYEVIPLLVLDGTAGQIVQTQIDDFSKAIPLQGLIFTKADSSSKGGTLVRAFAEKRIPIWAWTDGQEITDWRPFDFSVLTELMGLTEEEK